MALIKFHSPCKFILCGCTSSGKTTFIRKLLNNLDVFDEPPKKIYYFYGVYQPSFETMTNAECIQGLPNDFCDYFSPTEHHLAIIDDLQEEVSSSKAVEKLFTRESHHKNFSVCLLTQNLFYQGKICRTLALNAHVIILFKNPRSQSQLRILESQTGVKNICAAFNDVMKTPFSYLVIDMSPFADEKYRLRSCIFNGEFPIIYE